MTLDGSTALTDPAGALTDPDAYIAMQFASTALSNPDAYIAMQFASTALSNPAGALTGPDGDSPP